MGIQNFGSRFLGDDGFVSGSSALARCPSISEFYKQPCAREHGHPGLCYDSDRNHGSWEDRYRSGYRPNSENELLDAVGALLVDLEKAIRALEQHGSHRQARKLREHEERLKAAVTAEALK
jgi:hypothetical protein